MLRNKNGSLGNSQDTRPSLYDERLLRKIRRLERELVIARRFANHDPLTGLPNRALMLDRLKQALSQAARQGKTVGVLLIDLDGFKKVNDVLGHPAGDTVLQRVAARLLSCIRACDTACRYGGDEFVILLPEIQGVGEVETVKQKILEHLSKPHRLGRRVLVVGGSIGGAMFGRGAASCEALIAAADAAMYRAKRLPRDASRESPRTGVLSELPIAGSLRAGQ
jgi:diguanylate cyclase